MPNTSLLAKATVRTIDGKETEHTLIIDWDAIRNKPNGIDADPAFSALVKAQERMREGTRGFTMLDPMVHYNAANVSAITYTFGPESPDSDQAKRRLGFFLSA